MGAIEDMEKRLAKNPSNGLRSKLEQLRKEHARTTPTIPPLPPSNHPDVSTMNAKDAIAFIKTIDDYENLEVALKQEEKRDGGSRSTVLSAIDVADEKFE